MALAGITAVGEFHYLHHGPGGTPYADPNEMGRALIAAAAEAGMRITLLDACYLHGGIGAEPEGVQRRFADADAERVGGARRGARGGRRGAASAPRSTASARSTRDPRRSSRAGPASASCPLHAHVSEQPAENEACAAAYGAHARRAARRRRRARRALHGRPRHPPRRRGRRRCWARRPRPAASARRPSATSPTASARRGGSRDAGAGSHWAPTRTR